MGDQYSIINLEKYAVHARKRAALLLSDKYEEDLDSFVTKKQAAGLVVEYSIGKDEDGKYLIDDHSYNKLIEAIKVRIYNCGLSKLASEDKLECAWDDKKNEMIFWAKS